MLLLVSKKRSIDMTVETTSKDKQITIDVPEDRVAEFYAFYGHFLAGFPGRRRRGGPGRGGPGPGHRGGHGHGHGPHGHRCRPHHEQDAGAAGETATPTEPGAPAEAPETSGPQAPAS
jgi:hypothetical protein